MAHTPIDDQRWEPAGHDHFTGDVEFNHLSEPDDADGLRVLGVRFQAGARTDWHYHPGGQVLYVVSGAGLEQNAAGVTNVLGPGDVVETPPNEVHWHGAAPDSEMVHLSLTTNGATEWRVDQRSVSAEDYQAR